MLDQPIVIALPGVNAYLLEVAPAGVGPAAVACVAGGAGGGAAADAGVDAPESGSPPAAPPHAFVLIDTGYSFAWPQLHRALDAAGCRPGTLRLVAITHGDMDHTGNLLRLRDEYGAPVAMHPADAARMQVGIMPKRTSPSLRGRVVLRLAAAMRLIMGHRRAGAGVIPDLILEDGMRLDGYGLAARVIHIPGHTPGSVAVLTDDGSLFSGDTLFDAKRPLLLMEDPSAFHESVAALCGLCDQVTMVYPGHGKSFPGAHLTRVGL